MKVGDHIEPQWSQGPILPPTLVDLLDAAYQDNAADDEAESEECINDYEELLEYLDDEN